MIWNKRGVTREVFLIGPYAFKVPKLTKGWTQFLHGLLANMQEVSFGAKMKSGERYSLALCPVLFSLPGGFLVVMPRCRPITEAFHELILKGKVASIRCVAGQWIDCFGSYLPIEAVKIDGFGFYKARLVAVDYGS